MAIDPGPNILDADNSNYTDSSTYTLLVFEKSTSKDIDNEIWGKGASGIILEELIRNWVFKHNFSQLMLEHLSQSFIVFERSEYAREIILAHLCSLLTRFN